jgi:hypothetical protein
MIEQQSLEVMRKEAAKYRRMAETIEGCVHDLESASLDDGDIKIAAGGEAPKRRGRPVGSKAENKANKGEGGQGKRRGRPRKNVADAPKMAKKLGAPAGKRPKNEVKLPALVVNILNHNKKGLELDEVVAQVLEAGYKTSSTQEDGLSKIVYQTLHKLVGKKELVKDEESRYKITAA